MNSVISWMSCELCDVVMLCELYDVVMSCEQCDVVDVM